MSKVGQNSGHFIDWGTFFSSLFGHIIAFIGVVYHLGHVLSIFGALNLSGLFVLTGYAENLLIALFF